MKTKIFTMALLSVIGTEISAQTNNPDDYKEHVTILASDAFEGRGLGTKGKDEATLYIQKQFKKAGLQPFVEDYLQPFNFAQRIIRIPATNVIGMIEGSDPALKNQYIVLGAHYDHLGYINRGEEKVIYSGADDNASGVSAIIELAKHFAKKENRPKRSLIFIAFDAEESGLHGSTYFVNNLSSNIKENTIAMFSFDMVGMLQANNGIDLKGITSITNGKEIAEKYAGDINLYEVNNMLERQTDTYPFGKIGIPAVHVFTGEKSPYHQPEDKAHLLDYDGMVKLNKFMAKVITDVANNSIMSSEYVKSLEKNIKMKRFNFGVLANIGSGAHLFKNRFYNAKYAFSYGMGLQMNYKLSKVWQMQLAPSYEYATSQSEKGVYKRHSVVLPLNFEVGTRTYDFDSGRFFFAIGGYFRHTFDAKDGVFPLTTNDYYQNEIGYNFGFGIDSKKWRVAYTFRRGLTTLSKYESKVFQVSSFLTLGYRF